MRSLLLLFAAALFLVGARPSYAQEAGPSSSSVVVRRAPALGVGDVGAELLGERARRIYRQEHAAARQRRDPHPPPGRGTTAELTEP